jgi:hypothetical protein
MAKDYEGGNHVPRARARGLTTLDLKFRYTIIKLCSRYIWETKRLTPSVFFLGPFVLHSCLGVGTPWSNYSMQALWFLSKNFHAPSQQQLP